MLFEILLTGAALASAAPSTLQARQGPTFSASFTQYSGCNQPSVACGLNGGQYHAAVSQNFFGVGPGGGAGPGCGICFSLTSSVPGTAPITVKIDNLCPIDGNPLCGQDGLQGTNSMDPSGFSLFSTALTSRPVLDPSHSTDTTEFSPYQSSTLPLYNNLTPRTSLRPRRLRPPKMDYLQEEEYYPAPDASNDSYQASQPNQADHADETDPFNGMPPPPEGSYSTLAGLMSACQTHARAHGYACVTSSNNYKRGIAYVRCDRGGEYVNHWKLTPETRVRKNRTRRLVGCNWKARAKRTNDGLWQLTMMNGKHNGHGQSENATQHPSLRQLPREAMEEARDMFKAMRSPKEVLEALQRRYNPDVTAQDVYNLKAKIARMDSRQAAEAGGAEVQMPETPQMTRTEEAGPPTDPRLMEQAPMQQASMLAGEPPKRAGKCQCTCCDH